MSKFGAVILSMGLVLLASARSSAEMMKPEEIQIFWRHHLGIEVGEGGHWLEVWAGEKAVSRRLIHRSPLDVIRTAGDIRVASDERGNLRLILKVTGSPDITLAHTQWKKGWFPPVELCRSPVEGSTCRVLVEREADTRSGTIRLVAEKVGK